MAKRSVWKGPFINENFFRNIHLSGNKKIKTTSRNTFILPFLIGRTVQVHNGKFFIPVNIVEEMVGHKLGEFVTTRLRHVYKKKKLKNNGSKIKP
jgi:small subunit ribosomal protein S19